MVRKPPVSAVQRASEFVKPLPKVSLIKRLKDELRDKPAGPIPAYVYVISDGLGLCKIGRSENPTRRLSDLQPGSSAKLVLAAAIPTLRSSVLETIIHKSLAHLRERGEWFRIAADEAAEAIMQAASALPDEDAETMATFDAELANCSAKERRRLKVRENVRAYRKRKAGSAD